MTFERALAYLTGTIDETASRRGPYRLERMRAFLRELDDPQEAYPTIHVGGTSGKGSTATMIAAALQASGARTGLHTKPHFWSPVERALVDGVPISPERFAATLSAFMPAIDRVTMQHGRPSYYETLLALAFTYFRDERVDAAVIEVGLGGTLDGTNVLRRPHASVITTVGFDHMDVLGETLPQIAAEKAGIAKTGVPLVVGVESAAALAAIVARAREVGAPVVLVDDVARVVADDAKDGDAKRQRFFVETPRATYRIATPALGTFQRRNAATAIATLEILPDALRPAVNAVENAFANVSIPGRMEVLDGSPTLVFDIAHNAEKAEHLAVALRERFPGRTFRFVVAIGKSKDAREILRTLAPLAARFTFTRFEATGRPANDPEELAAIARSFGSVAEAVAEPDSALASARRLAAPADVVVITGSTFVVAELRALHA